MPSQLDIEEQRWRDAFNEGDSGVQKLAQETLDLRAKVKRLEAITDATFDAGVRKGMETAAKIAGQFPIVGSEKIAASIRAAAKDLP